jgi:hypothetical protein
MLSCTFILFHLCIHISSISLAVHVAWTGNWCWYIRFLVTYPGIILLFCKVISKSSRALICNRLTASLFQSFRCEMWVNSGVVHIYPGLNKVCRIDSEMPSRKSGLICFCTVGSWLDMVVSHCHRSVAQLPSMFYSSASGFSRAGVLQMSHREPLLQSKYLQREDRSMAKCCAHR